MSSVQFRSRIKPAFDYSETLNSYGVCCGTTGDNKTVRSFAECFNEGGHFVPVPDGNIDNVRCPDSDTRLGCCCACSYVTPGELDDVSSTYISSGTRSQISRCECNRLGGHWTETSDGNCPTLSTSNLTSLCGSPDVRTPKSCCHLEFDTNTGWPTNITCTNVCLSGDCAERGTDVYPSVFGTDTCATTNCPSSTYYSYIATKSTLYEDFPMGSCYTLVDNEGTLEYSCALTPESLCEGYWVIEQDEDNAFCTSAYQPNNPQKVSGKYQVQSMDLTTFNDLGLTAGDEYQGGIYIGIFKPYPLNPVSSEVYGNLSFGDPVLSSFNADSVGGTDSQWAIIVDPLIYSVPFLQKNEIDIDYTTSLWDGYYNTYGDSSGFNGIVSSLTNTIKYTDRGGFIDYYLPSIYELYFYAAYLQRNSVTKIGNVFSSSIFNTKYLNQTTYKSKINGNSFLYGIGINDNYSVNYKTLLVDKKNTETALFFRRIVLT